MSAVDELVRQWMAKVEASGEMRSAAGKPLPLGDGSEQVPESLRLAYKALKNAGYVPDEVAMMRKVADLRAKLEHSPAGAECNALEREIAELDARIRIRLEHLRSAL